MIDTATAATNHPLVHDLIKRLPPLGEPWALDDRVAWLTLAAKIFNEMYGDRGVERIERFMRARGERHGRAKLTAQQVDEIRGSDSTIYGLAKRFGVSRRQIKRIILGAQWRPECQTKFGRPAG
jgi:hypothetical protein